MTKKRLWKREHWVQFLILVSIHILVTLTGCNSDSGPLGYDDPDSYAPPVDSPTGSVDKPNTGNGDLTGSAALDAEEQSFLQLINDYRAQYGLAKLSVSVTLTRAADWMSVDMATKNYFSHTDSGGRDPFSRMGKFGYSSYTMGENIAAGSSTGQAAFTQWKNSPAHNANMLSGSYRAIGIGRAYDPDSTYKWYWTTDFGGSAD